MSRKPRKATPAPAVQTGGSLALPVLKGALAAIIVSLAGVLLYALIIKMTDMSDSGIIIGNQVLKVLSVFVGTMWGMRRNPSRGLIKGVLIGLLYTLFGWLAFWAWDGTLPIGVGMLIELAFAAAAGALAGILLANIRHRR